MAGSEPGNVEIRTLETKVLGALLHVGFGVERVLLGDEDLLWLWRDWRQFLGRLWTVRSRFRDREGFLALYLMLPELTESSSLRVDGISGVRKFSTLTLDSCGSEPRLC